MTSAIRLAKDFYLRNAYTAAMEICGKILCVRQPDGTVLKRRITETECYLGEEDSACHAHRGKTGRTQTMYCEGGVAYVYLCYGIHDMLNIVTGQEGQPQAVLIRGVQGIDGPGRLTRSMGITRVMNGVSFTTSDILWLESDGYTPRLNRTPRIGISYASREDQEKLWRFVDLEP